VKIAGNVLNVSSIRARHFSLIKANNSLAA